MFQSWRFKLRKAEETLKSGRLDEARDLLTRGDLKEYLPGSRLAARVASELGQRARQHARGGDWRAAWSDLTSAIELGGQTNELVKIRQELIESVLASVRQRLAAGDTSAAMELLEDLERRSLPKEPLEVLRQVTRQLQSAEKLACRGRFADADRQLSAAVSLFPDLTLLREKRAQVRSRQEQSRPLRELLHQALSSSDWREALSLADQLLELAPECRLAKDARRKAWANAGAKRADSGNLGTTEPWSPSKHEAVSRDGWDGPEGSRFLLWVDGVGGFLVCLNDEVVLGQARPGNWVDVPIMADISRKHARIKRGGEGYWVEPFHAIRVNGRVERGRTLLVDGDEIELGNCVTMRFRRPHALSASARLEFLSRHRTHPSADGVLLMAESCVLGPKWQNHVVCRDWSNDVVLYRNDESLFCRAMESIEIDGELCDGRGRLGRNSHVLGSDFSMSLEELDRCATQPLL